MPPRNSKLARPLHPRYFLLVSRFLLSYAQDFLPLFFSYLNAVKISHFSWSLLLLPLSCVFGVHSNRFIEHRPLSAGLCRLPDDHAICPGDFLHNLREAVLVHQVLSLKLQSFRLLLVVTEHPLVNFFTQGRGLAVQIFEQLHLRSKLCHRTRQRRLGDAPACSAKRPLQGG